MTQFTQHTGIILPLDIANIDTDSIIPKQFLKATSRANFGKYVFFNWRFLENTTNIPNKNFALNYPCYKNASVILTRKNFGCGSSREHAVWALIDYGFKAIIAPSFADIFYKNSFNNRLLLIILSENEINSLFEKILVYKIKLSCTINLCQKTICIQNTQYTFQINDAHLQYIINNVDKINLTLKHNAIIQKYEDNQFNFLK